MTELAQRVHDYAAEHFRGRTYRDCAYFMELSEREDSVFKLTGYLLNIDGSGYARIYHKPTHSWWKLRWKTPEFEVFQENQA